MRKKAAKPRGKRKPTSYGRTDLLSLATKGLTLSLGATMLFTEGAQRFFKEAIERGEKVDIRASFEKLISVSKKQAEYLRSVLEGTSKTGTSGLEAKIKERLSYTANRVQSSLKTTLQELNRRMLRSQGKSGKS